MFGKKLHVNKIITASYPGHCNDCGAILGNIKTECLQCGSTNIYTLPIKKI